ncbi:MAG: redoxin domain-containing protein [Balneola sp.]
MKTFIQFILISFFVTAQSLAQVNVGEQAPDFTLTSLDNEQILLEEFEGKVVYIFFFGAGCPHCRDNGPITENDIHQMYNENENFVALGIDAWNESAASVQNFQSVTGITYPLLLQGRDVLVDYYGTANAYDRAVVIGINGNIAYKGNSNVNNDVESVQNTIEEELALATSNQNTISELPSSIRLQQNYPNPFNPSTTISYALKESSNISLTIYNMLGVKITTLENGFRTAGEHTITFDASSLSSGIYIYKLTTETTTLTKRMTLLK